MYSVSYISTVAFCYEANQLPVTVDKQVTSVLLLFTCESDVRGDSDLAFIILLVTDRQ